MKTLINCGKKIELEVDFGEFGQEVTDHLMVIGARNVLRDVHAGVEDPAESRRRSVAKLAALYKGELSVRQAATPEALIAKAIERFSTEELQAALSAAKKAEREAEAAAKKAEREVDAGK